MPAMKTPGSDPIRLALQSASADQVALCQAISLPAEATDAPEWIHLMPNGTVTTVDGRGPYRVRDAAALALQSLSAGDRLPIDENHAIDIAAPAGQPAPARGWIVALQAREDGIWGKVEWTSAGRALVADHAYRHISPAIYHAADGTVTRILRASLVNRPNLRGLAALNQETGMNLLDQLRQALGLAEAADEAAVLAAVRTAHSTASTHAAQLAPIAKAVGLADSADGAAVLQAVMVLKDPAKMVPVEQVVALQAQLTELTGSFAKGRAEAFVDEQIKAGKPGVKPLRDHYIARHMADPAAVEKELGAIPALHAAGRPQPAVIKDGKVALNAEQTSAAKLLGLSAEDYAKTLAAEAATEETL
jgi:phage I-like protein